MKPQPPGRRATPLLEEMRVCLQPANCPLAAPPRPLLGTAAIWTRALRELLPGDPDLAGDLAADLATLLAEKPASPPTA